MRSPDEVVFLFDVDNTLLDNDRVEKDLRGHMEREFGKFGNLMEPILKAG
jgi:FMN phosphatase YigB (HAD superfamily)